MGSFTYNNHAIDSVHLTHNLIKKTITKNFSLRTSKTYVGDLSSVGIISYYVEDSIYLGVTTSVPKTEISISVSNNLGFTTTTTIYDDGGKWYAKFKVDVGIISSATVIFEGTITHPGYAYDLGKEVNVVYYNGQMVWSGPFRFELQDDGTYSVGGREGITYNDNLILPDTFNGKPVTAVTASGFYTLDNIKNVTIPEGYISIKNGAFDSSSLESITIPTSLEIIEDYAFYCSPLSEFYQYYTGESSLREICPYAFAETSLYSFKVPASVEIIRNDAFIDSIDLTYFYFEDHNQAVSVGANFLSGTNVLHLYLPENFEPHEDGVLNGTFETLQTLYISDATLDYIGLHQIVLQEDSFMHSLVCIFGSTVQQANGYTSDYGAAASPTVFLSTDSSKTVCHYGYAPTWGERLSFSEKDGATEYAVGWDSRYNITPTHITIPPMIWGKPITEIKEYGFYPYDDVNQQPMSSNLTTLTIPPTVDKIGKNAFLNNPLTSVRMEGYWIVSNDSETKYFSSTGQSQDVLANYLDSYYAAYTWTRDSAPLTVTPTITSTSQLSSSGSNYRIQLVVNNTTGSSQPLTVVMTGNYYGGGRAPITQNLTANAGSNTYTLSHPKTDSSNTVNGHSISLKVYYKYSEFSATKTQTTSSSV